MAADRAITLIDSVNADGDTLRYYRVSSLWLSEAYEMNRRLLQSLEECRAKNAGQ